MSDKKKKFELDDGRGFLFKNTFKTKANQPAFTGQAKVDGKAYKVSLWKKETKKGDPMLSLSFQPPMEEIKDAALPF